MKITDEMLNGFLDAQLGEKDMEQVRLALETNDDLVMRLAELSEVDAFVKAHASEVERYPLSAGLAETVKKLEGSNVITPTFWQKIKHSTNNHLAIAASVAVLFGVAVSSYLQSGVQSGLVSDVIAKALDNSASTESVNQADGGVFTANLSFENHQGELCRHFELVHTNNKETYIACKIKSGWQIRASSQTINTDNGAVYQMAANNEQLDEIIDSMIQGTPLDRAQETNAIANQWQIK
jgi:hypothetical protein